MLEMFLQVIKWWWIKYRTKLSALSGNAFINSEKGSIIHRLTSCPYSLLVWARLLKGTRLCKDAADSLQVNLVGAGGQTSQCSFPVHN